MSLLAVSAAFLAYGTRADHFVYGRYVDVITPLMIALAIAWLGSSPGVRALLYGAAALISSFICSTLVLVAGGSAPLHHQFFDRVTTFSILGWLDYRRNSPALFRATAWTAAIGLVGIAMSLAIVNRTQPRYSRTVTVALSLGIAVLFLWQLSFLGPKVVTPAANQASRPRIIANTVHELGTREITLEPTITILDRLALQYWLPQVRFIEATQSLDRCGTGLSISHLPGPRNSSVAIAYTEGFYLYRAAPHCG